ncbi:MAG: FtsX-like permease family protein [Prevotella sp.]|nr:FtsX-like permease family protein [Prevotella sp.]
MENDNNSRLPSPARCNGRLSVSLFIARRYLFSKKSTNVINLISAISVIGVTVATMAMVVVLSVFNGFSDLVATFFTAFDPQIEIVPTKGKTVAADDPTLQRIRQMDEVDVTTECVQDQALAIYGDRQAMVTIKGVSDNFAQLTRINDICYGDGAFELHAADLQYGTPGIRLAQTLGMPARYDGFLRIYAPRRTGQIDLANPLDGFVADSLISPGVVFCVQQGKYDKSHVITSIHFARMLFQCDGELSSLEIKLKPGCDVAAVKREMQALCGDKYRVMDRYEQQEETFNIMKIEKFMGYIFLTFILVVACFNIIGSLSMLIIDKKKDADTLRSLGARDSLIRQIFVFEGWLISVIGAILGVGLGLLLCLLQQQFGIVSLGESSGSFVVDAYPVSVHYGDVALVFLTVIAVGFLSVLYPIKRMV